MSSIDKIREEVAAQKDDCGSGAVGWFIADIYRPCCEEHDVHYRAKDVSRAEADRIFRECIQKHSPLGKLSPLSWIRWSGVRLFGWLAD